MAGRIRQCAAFCSKRARTSWSFRRLAVQRGPHGLFTWVVKPDNTVEPRPIQTGATTATRTIVMSGVEDGERVVTDGQYKLQTNAPVSIAAPRTAASGDAT